MAKFQKGNCANPSGRPKGTPNRRGIVAGALDAASRQKGFDVKQAILDKLIDSALAGEQQNIKLLMDRLEPAFKPISRTIELSSPNYPGIYLKRLRKYLH